MHARQPRGSTVIWPNLADSLQEHYVEPVKATKYSLAALRTDEKQPPALSHSGASGIAKVAFFVSSTAGPGTGYIQLRTA